MSPPSPKKHPNAFAGLSSATVSAFIVYECNTRFGLNISELEAGFIVAAITSLYLFFGPKPSGQSDA